LKTVYARITDIKAGIDEDGTTLGEYSGKLAEMGINVLDAAGNLRNMGTVMEEIGEKWKNLTTEQQIYVAQTMAGQRQYSNLISLFDNFDKYEQAV
jgi:TP901 family phage tail tape measure protein